MASNWCSFLNFHNISNSTSTYYQVTLSACIVTSLLAPMTVAANVLILAAIWRNPSLRTPSYVLLAGLALTDFCTGLLTPPPYVTQKSAKSTRNSNLVCTGGLITSPFAHVFSYLRVVVMVMSAVERWLYMS